MEKRAEKYIGLLVFLQLFLCALNSASVRAGDADEKAEEVKGFVMTIVDKGGIEKAAVSGATANVLPGGIIKIFQVVSRIYDPAKNGNDTLVNTSEGIYDRVRNTVTSSKFVRISRMGMVVTGTGMKWYPDSSKLEIEESVRVEYSSVRKKDTAGLTHGENGTPALTVITSRGKAVMDYSKDTAVFNKNVRVEDKDAVLSAHKMRVYFSSQTHDIVKIEAYGNVRIKQPERESMSKRAVYYAKEDKLILEGRPRIFKGLDFYTAERVTIYDKGNRVVFEPKAELVIYSGEEPE